jgi:hypothetical protein
VEVAAALDSNASSAATRPLAASRAKAVRVIRLSLWARPS